jgi:predicted outer membrane repeat protein
VRACTGSTYEYGVQGSLQRLGVPEVDLNNSQEVTSMASLRVFACAAVAASLLGSVASAAELLVPSQYVTIQSAIDAAVAGDTVLVAPGAYNERLDMKGKAITLKGANGYTQTILDPLGTAGYLLTAQTGETQAGTIIDGFSFRNSPTGGMKVVSAGVTVKNCRFLGNTAAQGPAMWIQTGNVFVDNTQFVSNVASDRGGAIYTKQTTTLRLNNCVFNGNKSTGTRGGAIYSESTTIDFDGTQFNSNREEAGDESYGGAIYLLSCGGTIDLCGFVGNKADSGLKSYGGSLYLDASSPRLEGCTFSACWVYTSRGGNNSESGAYGGSVYMVNSSAPWFSQCHWTGAKAESTGAFGGGNYAGTVPSTLKAQGGALHGRDSCNAKFVGCTFIGAIARTEGSGSSAYASNFPVLCLSYGGAAWFKRCNPQFEDCVFLQCRSEDAASGSIAAAASHAGAIWTEDLASPSVLRTRFTNNTSRFGGAMFMTGQSSPFISDCSYIGNNGTIQGGVMYSEHSIPNFADTLFQNNTSPSGSVAYSTSTASNYPAIGTSVFCGNLGTDMVGGWYNDPGNVLLDSCPEDCNGNGTNDRWDILGGVALDCNGNLTPDSCDITANPAIDCNQDGIPDSCQASTPGFGDCDGDGVVDACEPDCNSNGQADVCEIRNGTAPDCNMNGIPDSCDIVNGRGADCDADGVLDSCQADCNGNGVPNACEIAAGAADCDSNGIPDSCQFATGDANNDGVLDSCQTVDFAGLEVELKPIVGTINGLASTAVCWRVYATFSNAGATVSGIFGDSADPMAFSVTGGFFQSPSGGNLGSENPCVSSDLSLAYDSFLTLGGDCMAATSASAQGVNFTAFQSGGAISVDSATGGIVYQLPGAQVDASGRVLLMQLTTNTGVKPNAIFNLIGDNATKGADNEWYAFGLSLPDPVLVDCNSNGVHDSIEIASGLVRDCNLSGVPDSCEFPSAIVNADCDGDGALDYCEIFAGAETDANGNWILDDCECLGDVDGNGAVNVDDLIEIIAAWGDSNPGAADLDGDGSVGAGDLTLVLQGWGSCI